jgi:hypothetical protein
VACEIICADQNGRLVEGLKRNPSLLAPLWDFLLDLDRQAGKAIEETSSIPMPASTSSVQNAAVFFSRLNIFLLDRMLTGMLKFLEEEVPDAIGLLVRHLHLQPVMELLLRLFALPGTASRHRNSSATSNFSVILASTTSLNQPDFGPPLAVDVLEWLRDRGRLHVHLASALHPLRGFDSHNAVAQFVNELMLGVPFPASYPRGEMLEPFARRSWIEQVLGSIFAETEGDDGLRENAQACGLECLRSVLKALREQKQQKAANTAATATTGAESDFPDSDLGDPDDRETETETETEAETETETETEWDFEESDGHNTRASSASNAPSAAATASSASLAVPMLSVLLGDHFESLNDLLLRGPAARVGIVRLRMLGVCVELMELGIAEGLGTRVFDRLEAGGVFAWLLEAFFVRFPENSFLQHAVVDLLRSVLAGDGRATGFRAGRHLIGPAHRLGMRLIAAQNAWEVAQQQPRGCRLNMMGHVTRLAELLGGWHERSGVAADESWRAYWAGAVKETRLRDARVLGGIQPPRLFDLGQEPPASNPGTASLEYNALFSSADDERLARYFCQQIIGNVPGHFLYDEYLSSDEDRSRDEDLNEDDEDLLGGSRSGQGFADQDDYDGFAYAYTDTDDTDTELDDGRSVREMLTALYEDEAGDGEDNSEQADNDASCSSSPKVSSDDIEVSILSTSLHATALE